MLSARLPPLVRCALRAHAAYVACLHAEESERLADWRATYEALSSEERAVYHAQVAMLRANGWVS